MKIKINIMLSLLFLIQIKTLSQNFEGYYIEVIGKSPRNMQTTTLELLMDEQTLVDYHY